MVCKSRTSIDYIFKKIEDKKMNIVIAITILIFGLGLAFFREKRNEWILNNKLKVFEIAIKKRNRNIDEGKPYLLLEQINKALWSYEKMLWCFWIKDIKDMFRDEEVRKYVYDEEED